MTPALRKPLGAPLTGHTDAVFGVGVSPGGALLASAGASASGSGTAGQQDASALDLLALVRPLHPQACAACPPRFAAVPPCRSGGIRNRGGRRRTIPDERSWSRR